MKRTHLYSRAEGEKKARRRDDLEPTTVWRDADGKVHTALWHKTAAKKEFMVVNGRRHEDCDKVLALSKSPGGRRSAVTVKTARREQRAVIDGEVGEAFVHVKGVVFSDDDAHVAFSARRGGKYVPVVNGDGGDPFTYVADPVFVGARPLFATNTGGKLSGGYCDGGLWSLPDTEGTFGPVAWLQADRRREGWAAIVREAEENVNSVVRDGRRVGASHRNLNALLGFVFTADGTLVHVAPTDDEGMCLVRDGEPGPRFGSLSDVTTDVTGERLVYWVDLAGRPTRRGHKEQYILDGVATPVAETATQGRFSADGKRFAYIQEVGKERRVVIDGEAGPAFGTELALHNTMLQFGPKGRRTAYFGVRGEQSFLVLDGRETSLDLHPRSSHFSPGGRHLVIKFLVEGGEAWSVDGEHHHCCDNAATEHWGTHEPLVFSDDDAHWAFIRVTGKSKKKARYALVVDGVEQEEGFARLEHMHFDGAKNAFVALGEEGDDAFLVEYPL